MKKNEVSQENIELLGAYNDFMEALAENGINPFQIEQSRRIQMFIDAVALFNQEQIQESETIQVPVDSKITEFFIQIGIIQEIGELMGETLASMDTMKERQDFADKINDCHDPMVMIKTIQESINISKRPPVRAIEILATIIKKVQGLSISKRN